jgi:putative lipoprotein (rSAM/lipoprotein system)
MKDLIIRFCHWALALLGLGATNGCKGPGVICEYGVPTAEYRVSGKVIDSMTENPIKGIAVNRIDETTREEYTDTVWTSKDGKFVCEGNNFPTGSIVLKFTDVDGTANGDQFQTKEVKVTLIKEQDGKGNWNYGVYAAEDLLIRLDPELPTVLEYGVPYTEYNEQPKAEQE